MKAVFSLFLLTGAGFLISESILQKQAAPHTYADSSYKNYLALGDSYTIGQSVDAKDNFPNQLAESLKEKGIQINDPEIRAATGWTTGDLIASLRTTPPLRQQYDLVTLLIGVNNQFQQRTLTEYETEFRFHLNKAINLAGGRKKLLVLSIPDYSVMPFAEGSDTRQTAKEINIFNNAKKKICAEAGIVFINITAISRKGKKVAEMQADDGLHPSGKQYGKWVHTLVPKAMQALKPV